jgi:hypothetical protein
MSSIETNEYLVYDRDLGLAVTFDSKQNIEHHETVIKRLFRVDKNDNVTELPVEKMVNDLTEALIHTLDVKALMKKVLGEMTPNDLVKAHDIITKNPEMAKQARAMPGCLFIQLVNPIPGEPAIEIPIRY